MKIYFEDGKLKYSEHFPFIGDYIVDAGDGYSACINKLDCIAKTHYSSTVYTNFLPALDSKYAWDTESNTFDIYFRNKTSKFMHIDAFTERELRRAHNIMHMYMNDVFDLDIELTDNVKESKMIILNNIQWDAPRSAGLPNKLLVFITDNNKYVLEGIPGCTDNLLDYVQEAYGYCVIEFEIEYK